MLLMLMFSEILTLMVILIQVLKAHVAHGSRELIRDLLIDVCLAVVKKMLREPIEDLLYKFSNCYEDPSAEASHWPGVFRCYANGLIWTDEVAESGVALIEQLKEQLEQAQKQATLQQEEQQEAQQRASDTVKSLYEGQLAEMQKCVVQLGSDCEEAISESKQAQQCIDILKETETADRDRINFSNEEKAKLQAGKDATEAKLEVRNPNPSGHKAHTL